MPKPPYRVSPAPRCPFSRGRRLLLPSKSWLGVVLLTGGLSLALLAGCSKAPEPPPPTPAPTPATPPPTPRPTPTPKPTPTPPPTPTPKPTPTPIVKHYAPDGVFFITEDITVRLPSGILGIEAGTRVQKVADDGDNMRVTDGKDTFEVKKSQLTTEIEAASVLQKQTQAADQANEQFRAQSDAVLQKQRRDYIEFLKTHPLATPTPTPK